MKKAATTYHDFRAKVESALKDEPSGLTWTEIKARLNLPQKVPNNKWVRMMERDIHLVREQAKGKGIIWRLQSET